MIVGSDPMCRFVAHTGEPWRETTRSTFVAQEADRLLARAMRQDAEANFREAVQLFWSWRGVQRAGANCADLP
jgi:hypothetical protein